MRSALIAGSTGLVGNELLKLLLQETYYDKIHVLLRKQNPIRHSKIKSYIVDFDEIDSFRIEEQITDVYICLGTTMKKARNKTAFRKVDHDYVLNIARWAKINGVKSVSVVSSLGVKSDSSSNFYLKTKFDMETDISMLQIERTFIFRPSLLLGERSEFRIAEKIGEKVIKVITPLLIGKLYKYRPVPASKVAKSMFYFMSNLNYESAIIENDAILNL